MDEAGGREANHDPALGGQVFLSQPDRPSDADGESDSQDPLIVLARAHAGKHQQAPHRIHLRHHLDWLEQQYRRIYTQIAERTETEERGTRAEEWLLDNRHVVQEALELVREGLPLAYVRQLPRVAGEPAHRGLRALALAFELIRRGEQPLAPNRLRSDIQRYQDVSALTLGELWALPLLLRLALLEALVAGAFEAIGTGAVDRDAPSSDRYGVEVASAILSLRNLQTHDWRDFVERLSPVEQCLCGDPAGAYARMDFDTRDRYRKAVEAFARTSGVSEIETAQRVIGLARERSDARPRHVGYFLIGEGQSALCAALGGRCSRHGRIRSALTRHATVVYLVALAVFSLPLVLGAAAYLVSADAGAWLLIAAALLATPLVLGLSVALVNGLITHALPPRVLPKMDFDAGLPDNCRTVVVVPVLFHDARELDSVLNRVEINYLGNDDPNLSYAVLSDFSDADTATGGQDDALLARVRQRIETLNATYPDRTGAGRFLLLHRTRRWNEAQGCWMGWERKRGKLLEFNRLLAGEGDGSFETTIGERSVLEDIRYVITLDADTGMPPGTARRLVGTMAHPLNRAVFDSRQQRVTAGYGFLQPRLDIGPGVAAMTPFTRIFAGDTTVDIYTRAVSDAYQDLFGEGVFTGKGIYDPGVFTQTLAGRIPENVLLSHDLLEGELGRTALMSDALFYEQYPPNLFSYLRRFHRWVRGDWQLLPWLGRRVATADGQSVPNPLTTIHRWRIVDNLRRSIESPCTLALFLLAWSGLLPGAVWGWTLAVLALTATPVWIELLALLWRGIARPMQAHREVQATPVMLRHRLEHWLLSLLLLPYSSLVVLDAVARSLYRMAVSRRHLLEWQSAAQVQHQIGGASSSGVVWQQMWQAPVFACALAAALAFVSPWTLLTASPLIVAWLIAPQVAHAISRPTRSQTPPLTAEDREELRLLARGTWRFFERFMGPDDHWLPPDNYQEEPVAVLARRTSPTNIGLGLLATLSAHDFGYIDLDALIARLSISLERLQSLERYRGHFLNWYETRELHPLQPCYVSTVDSGNLAACLLTLARGLEQLLSRPVSGAPLLDGALDTLGVLERSLEAGEAARTIPGASALAAEIGAIRDRASAPGSDAPTWWQRLERLYERDLPILESHIVDLIESGDHPFSSEAINRLRHWLDEVHRQSVMARRSLDGLEPWLRLLGAPPDCYCASEVDADLRRAFEDLRQEVATGSGLARLPDTYRRVEAVLERLGSRLAHADIDDDARNTAVRWNESLRQSFRTAIANADSRADELRELINRADALVAAMDFTFLYDSSRHLFRIGYNVTDARRDPNFYDLLASEARLAGFVAIAKGDAPAQHWLHLGRPFRRLKGDWALMSWGGSLFEFLMPRLLMRTPDNSLLGRACRSAIGAHIRFGRTIRLPWGISESAYYELDEHRHYQYRAFGVPGIGFRRDLGDRTVVSAYSAIMALPFKPREVVANIRALGDWDGMGEYGLYEAVDFGDGADRNPRRGRVVRAYMSHHQGMVLLALGNCLHDDRMLARFHADPRVAGLETLLYERVPAVPPALSPWPRPQAARSFRAAVTLETFSATVRAPWPRYNLLSNGHYSVFQASDGGGGARWDDTVLTRWRADGATDAGGHWCYVRDLDSDCLFSVGLDPIGGEPGDAAAFFGPHTTEYHHSAQELFCRLRIAISSQYDLEARYLSIKNERPSARRLLVASCAEVVLTTEAADQRHPAFGKLFVESRYLAEQRTMLYRCRPRSDSEKPVYMAHAVVPPDVDHVLRWETDRECFLGRGGSPAQPRGVTDWPDGFTGSTGSVLDPVIATGIELTLPPHAEIEIGYLTAVSRSRQRLVPLMASYRAMARVHWIFEQARMQSEQELYNLGIAARDFPWMSDLLSALLVPNPALRASGEILGRSRAIQGSLWSRGISGDHPILLVCIHETEAATFAEPVLQAHAFWCGRGQAIDLVLLHEGAGGYMQPTRDRLQTMVNEMRRRTRRSVGGAVFVIPGQELPGEERIRLMAAARVLLDSTQGTVDHQLAAFHSGRPWLPEFLPTGPAVRRPEPTPALDRPENLLFDNGLGGFSPDGREYVIHMSSGQQRPPAPWVNVIAQPSFGCLVSESGASCTWARNSGEYRLSPWNNDPVCDRGGEAVYLRDEETAEVWSPTPAPRPAPGPYQVRHGAGYTEFRHNSHGLVQNWCLFVDQAASVKIGRLKLTNSWSWTRRVTATYYVEWVLGTTRWATTPHVVTDYDARGGVLLARNTFTREARPGVAFLAANLPPHGLTTDRTEFLGRGGSVDAPEAMFRIGLSGSVASGCETCAAYQVHLDLGPGDTRYVYFVLGHGDDRADALDLAERYGAADRAEASLADVTGFWESYLEQVQVETPDPAMNLLVNRWLPYQTLACRFWGRTAFYQSSGAFGFRDQLQDVLALLWHRPRWTRAHILVAASRQFQDGDVLHWWHEQPLRGVRTRCSDDLLWLPFATAEYVRTTGDRTVLQESVPYLAGAPLEKGETERYAEFEQSREWGSLYEHCCRAIERAAAVGPHGLPTIGGGDWNDGFNRISTTGRGESVWLGWFLVRICRDFVPICREMGDKDLADHYQQLGETLAAEVEACGWDGDWYRRAYFDDGSPLGSAENDECRIDLIAQAWAVLSGEPPGTRAHRAMQSVYEQLVRTRERQILLLAPPFNLTKKDPGYIKGYPPGIRENGGQYTHAATWAVWAAAGLGDGERALQLFQLLNPILLSTDASSVRRYRTEPYVLAGDVYSVAPHVGRGGWTWYTGAAGWLYRGALEALLGLKRHGTTLEIAPCLPASWQGYTVHLRHGRSRYEIRVTLGDGSAGKALSVSVDGRPAVGNRFDLVDDGRSHSVQVRVP